jgi:hypothetical protein
MRINLLTVAYRQISLLSGNDFWRTVPLPNHGIPSIKTTDGPNGARGEFFKNGTKVSTSVQIVVSSVDIKTGVFKGCSLSVRSVSCRNMESPVARAGRITPWR